MVAKYFVCECGDMQEFAGRLSVKYSDYAALEARVSELEKDAARYRWLRDVTWISDEFGFDLRIAIQFQRSALWDEMIDEAMSREA